MRTAMLYKATGRCLDWPEQRWDPQNIALIRFTSAIGGARSGEKPFRTHVHLTCQKNLDMRLGGVLEAMLVKCR